MSQTIELIKALTPLAWPLLLGVILWKLFPAVKAIFESRGFSIKVADMEISVQEAAQQFRTQIEDLQKQLMLVRAGRPQQQPAGPSLRTFEARATEASAKSSRILWVDDHPEGNALEIAQLKDRGFDVIQADSMDNAIAILTNDPGFAAVISALGRRQGAVYSPQADLAFLDAMKRAGSKVPFFAYTSPKSAAQSNQQVRSAGGDGASASPIELLEWIERKTRAG
ncbi:MAG TPA: Orn/Lys/Arg decarboxylase N-terminal domain-containing protein [Xanthobacteraceae bacterium]|jgi:CheY-like chemotaxis protein